MGYIFTYWHAYAFGPGWYIVVLVLIQVVNKYGKGYVSVLFVIWNNSKRLLITCFITCNEKCANQ